MLQLTKIEVETLAKKSISENFSSIQSVSDHSRFHLKSEKFVLLAHEMRTQLYWLANDWAPDIGNFLHPRKKETVPGMEHPDLFDLKHCQS